MVLTSKVKISDKPIADITQEEVDQLAQRLEKDEYTTAFEGLQDWHRLRSVAFQRPELVDSYLHLLDVENFDDG